MSEDRGERRAPRPRGRKPRPVRTPVAAPVQEAAPVEEAPAAAPVETPAE